MQSLVECPDCGKTLPASRLPGHRAWVHGAARPPLPRPARVRGGLRAHSPSRALAHAHAHANALALANALANALAPAHYARERVRGAGSLVGAKPDRIGVPPSLRRLLDLVDEPDADLMVELVRNVIALVACELSRSGMDPAAWDRFAARFDGMARVLLERRGGG